jgi:hypothetical protein
MKSVLTYALSNSNYSVVNIHNFYNFIIAVMEENTDEENDRLMDLLILHVGRSFYKSLKIYVCEKIPNSRHMTVINRKV